MQAIAGKDAPLAAQRHSGSGVAAAPFRADGKSETGQLCQRQGAVHVYHPPPATAAPASWLSPEMLGMGSAEDYLAEGCWPTPAVDGKRPYGNFTNYTVEMAQALGLPLHRQADGSLVVTPACAWNWKRCTNRPCPRCRYSCGRRG
jgi:hypothetical protein